MRITLCALAAAFAGCASWTASETDATCPRSAALPAAAWNESVWISAPQAKVADAAAKKASRAADGTSWFRTEVTNAAAVTRAVWMTTGLGVYEIYANGRRVGTDALKPGFTHVRKTRRAFTYDVTALWHAEAGAVNALAAEVSAGWWRDKIVDYAGRKSAFRGVLELTFADGSKRTYGTRPDAWRAAVGGPVTHAGIYDGEECDARIAPPAATVPAEENREFAGEILPTDGAEVCLRRDLALKPVLAYAWKGVTGVDAAKGLRGEVAKTRVFKADGPLEVAPGETLVVDFGQNAAAVPAFEMTAPAGTVLTCLPGEMLNDAHGEESRGDDGPGGSVYRVNLRASETCMRLVYTFRGDAAGEKYLPRFTFFGYRYVSITATAPVRIASLLSVPVTSVAKEMEIGSLETGDAAVNRLISNVRWGQLSNYLSVPTDCPQRNERLGWTADTQVFADAGAYNADTRSFFRKWMRDMRDTTNEHGSFPGVAPYGQYGSGPHKHMRTGWADAGIIVPWKIWRQFGDRSLVDENWAAMERFALHSRETKRTYEAVKGECGDFQWNDWLSLDKFESCSSGLHPELDAFYRAKDGKTVRRRGVTDYWSFVGACYWAIDMGMMKDMAAATGRDVARWAAYEAEAKAWLAERYFATSDGTVRAPFDDMQTPAVLALKLGLVEGAAKAKTIAFLKADLKRRGNVTGFLGNSWLMDVLSDNGEEKMSVDLLLNHAFPSWLYSVDQGATTIWERWNGWTKDHGFGPVGMNSYNHYAYGQVLGWMYRRLAGIEPDVASPGFRRIVMRPILDRRLGHVTASYRSAAGPIESAWRFDGDAWTWTFTIPDGATALVTDPGTHETKTFGPGVHTLRSTVR